MHEAASDTPTVGSVFAIDPNRAILDLMYYRTQLGRKVDELLRVFCDL